MEGKRVTQSRREAIDEPMQPKPIFFVQHMQWTKLKPREKQVAEKQVKPRKIYEPDETHSEEPYDPELLMAFNSFCRKQDIPTLAWLEHATVARGWGIEMYRELVPTLGLRIAVIGALANSRMKSD